MIDNQAQCVGAAGRRTMTSTATYVLDFIDIALRDVPQRRRQERVARRAVSRAQAQRGRRPRWLRDDRRRLPPPARVKRPRGASPRDLQPVRSRESRRAGAPWRGRSRRGARDARFPTICARRFSTRTIACARASDANRSWPSGRRRPRRTCRRPRSPVPPRRFSTCAAARGSCAPCTPATRRSSPIARSAIAPGSATTS